MFRHGCLQGDALAVNRLTRLAPRTGKRHGTAARPMCWEKRANLRAKHASSFALLNHSTSTDCLSYAPRLREEKMDSHHAHNNL